MGIVHKLQFCVRSIAKTERPLFANEHFPVILRVYYTIFYYSATVETIRSQVIKMVFSCFIYFS